MPKFLLTYRGGSMPASEAEGAMVVKAWADWFSTLGPAVVDGGNPTSRGMTVNPDGSVTGDGRAAVSGYSVIAADDLESAIELAKGCPVLAGGAVVDVSETFDAM